MKSVTSLAANFRLWHPPQGHIVRTGADLVEFPLPEIPLPILTSEPEAELPSDDAIGSGLYDYLRQFPDCPYNSEYAALLRDAWPHYIADLGAMIVMLDHKEVDAPYIRRKITGLQILLLLDPDNSGLQLQLGISCYDLALNYVELNQCRSHLTRAMQYFSAVNKTTANVPATLNYMAQIDYLLGDYPSAVKRWNRVADLVEDEETRSAVLHRVSSIEGSDIPERPLLVDLESIGEAMTLLAEGDPASARAILERLEEEEVVTTEFPNPEFFSLLAVSRERSGDLSGAQASFARALELDPTHQTSLEGVDRLLERSDSCQTV